LLDGIREERQMSSVFSTDVANGIGRLAEIISHRCAQAHDPLVGTDLDDVLIGLALQMTF
jgi:hypothetical protein